MHVLRKWFPTYSMSYLSMILQVTDLEHLHHFPDEETDVWKKHKVKQLEMPGRELGLALYVCLGQKPYIDNILTCDLLSVPFAASWSPLPWAIDCFPLPGYKEGIGLSKEQGLDWGLWLEVFFCLLYFTKLEVRPQQKSFHAHNGALYDLFLNRKQEIILSLSFSCLLSMAATVCRPDSIQHKSPHLVLLIGCFSFLQFLGDDTFGSVHKRTTASFLSSFLVKHLKSNLCSNKAWPGLPLFNLDANELLALNLSKFSILNGDKWNTGIR